MDVLNNVAISTEIAHRVELRQEQLLEARALKTQLEIQDPTAFASKFRNPGEQRPKV